MRDIEGLPVLRFDAAAGWEAWLREHHASSSGAWLRIARKGSGLASVTRDEAVEIALCFGWIDGQGRSLDETSWLQKLTPRRPRSMWSKLNREKAEALIGGGRMQPAGLRQVELAKSDGRWEAAYDAPSTASVPDDLRRELDAKPRAAQFFAQLDARNRYAILHRIQTAKRPDTRERRIRDFVALLDEHRAPYPT